MRTDYLLALVAAILEAGDRANPEKARGDKHTYVQSAATTLIQAGLDPIMVNQYIRLGQDSRSE